METVITFIGGRKWLIKISFEYKNQTLRVAKIKDTFEEALEYVTKYKATIETEGLSVNDMPVL